MNFVNYTFKPGFSLFLVLVSVFTIVMLTAFYTDGHPLYFFALVVLYFALIGFCLFACMLNYLHYKKNAPRRMVYDPVKGKMVEKEIL